MQKCDNCKQGIGLIFFVWSFRVRGLSNFFFLTPLYFTIFDCVTEKQQQYHNEIIILLAITHTQTHTLKYLLLFLHVSLQFIVFIGAFFFFSQNFSFSFRNFCLKYFFSMAITL